MESKICIIGETTEVLSTLQRVLSLGYDGTRAQSAVLSSEIQPALFASCGRSAHEVRR